MQVGEFRPDDLDDRLVLCARVGVIAQPIRSEYDQLAQDDRRPPSAV